MNTMQMQLLRMIRAFVQ